MRRFLILLFLVAAVPPAKGAQTASETVELTSGDKPLKATLFRPDGPGPFPAVIALHDCGGLLDAKGAFRPHFAAWGEELVKSGMMVLFVDSYGSRRLGPQCRNPSRSVRPFQERVEDAQAARKWLLGRSDVHRERISLLGWANGGIAVLWTVRPRTAPRDKLPDFRAAVAFYPGCHRLGNSAWSARVPTLILTGASDDWAPARDCEQMVAGARGRTAKAAIVKYRGAHHAFDREGVPVHQRTGVAFTPDGSGRATVGSNPDARADAIRRVHEWLAR